MTEGHFTTIPTKIKLLLTLNGTKNKKSKQQKQAVGFALE